MAALNTPRCPVCGYGTARHKPECHFRLSKEEGRALTLFHLGGLDALRRPGEKPVACKTINSLVRKGLTAALEFTANEYNPVTIEFRGSDIVVVRTENETQHFTGLLVPLKDEKKS